MPADTKAPKLAEIADRIAAHLRRFEADPVVNAERDMSRPYREATAWTIGGWVKVRYHSALNRCSLTKATAIGYLAWLDAGGVGRHWEWERLRVAT